MDPWEDCGSTPSRGEVSSRVNRPSDNEESTMLIPRKALLAAGVSLGVGTLALVGTGTFAGLTGQVPVNASITSGTFKLSAVAGTPQVNKGNGQATLTSGSLTAAQVTKTGEGATLTYTLSNADPGHTYTIPFTVYDTGSLPGIVTSITYTPSGTTSSLAKNLTISVCWSFGTLATPANCKPIYGPQTPAPQKDSTTGATAFRFEKTGPGDNNLTNYLRSNPYKQGNTVTDTGHSSLTYEIVEHYSYTGATNTTEGKKTTQTFTVNGHNV